MGNAETKARNQQIENDQYQLNVIDEQLEDLFNDFEDLEDEFSIGSNNWAISGSKSFNGSPILANDPHRSIVAPSLRYLTHLVAPGWNVIGGGDWSENRLVPDIIRGILKKQKIKIRNPNAIRPWQFVLDPLHGYLLLIEKLAESGDSSAFSFPRPMTNKDNLDFSFSGLKTGILYFIQKNLKENPAFIEENLYDICASIQHTIVEILLEKLKNTVQQTGIKHIAIAGGVSANSEIRKRLQLAQKHWGWTTYIPKFEYTTDNAAMIAITGYLKYKDKRYADISVKAVARLKVSE